MFEWFGKMALKIAAGPVLDFAGGVVKTLSDSHTQIMTAKTGLAASQSAGVIAAERDRQAIAGNITMAMMTHKIWWYAWALFVFPFGCYVALIHIKSIACPFYVAACTWNIPRVPAQIEAWDTPIMLSFFGFAVASPVIVAIANRLGVVPK